MPSTLFLVYSPGKKFTYWTFPNISKYGWEWVGSGSTANSSLPNESQWTGPSKNKDKVKEILTEAHKKLQKKEIIDKFVITSSISKYMKGSLHKSQKNTSKRNSNRKIARKTTTRRKSSRKTTTRRKSSRKTTKKGSRKSSSPRRKNTSTNRRTGVKCGTSKYKKATNINTDKTRQLSGKYVTRNSPPYHASAYCGKNKKGNDGNLYFSKKMNNGSCRWVSI